MKTFTRKAFILERGLFVNPGPATTVTDHPLGGGGGPAYMGVSGGAVGFYQDPFGGGAVVQRSNSQQALVPQAATGGVLISLQSVSTITPTAIPAISVSSVPVTALAISFLTTDAFVASRPSGQAIGIVNMRAQSTPANVLLVDYANVSQQAITPSANDILQVAVIRNVAQAVSLAPASVAASTCAEQQFNVTGVAVGMVVNVQKPTTTLNIGVAGARVVSNNLLGVTYLNTSTAAITPPTENYLVTALNGLAAQNNVVVYGVNVGSVNPVTATTTGTFVVTENTFTVSGVGAQDIAVGVQKPTLQGQLTVPSVRITTANAIAFGFATGSISGVTPTASEIYATTVYKASPPAVMAVASVSLTPIAVGPGQATEQAFTVTPLAAFSPVLVNRPSATSGLGIGNVRVSAAGVLAITFLNPTTASITPPAETYLVGQFIPGTNQGGYVQMSVLNGENAQSNLTNELRNALAPVTGVGLIAGG